MKELPRQKTPEDFQKIRDHIEAYRQKEIGREITAGHLLDPNFNVHDLTEDDLNMYEKIVINRDITEEELNTYTEQFSIPTEEIEAETKKALLEQRIPEEEFPVYLKKTKKTGHYFRKDLNISRALFVAMMKNLASVIFMEGKKYNLDI